MSNIRYNEAQEAYELPYKIWSESITVRFYVDSEETIMQNLTAIAGKLETVNGGKKKLAQLIADEGRYEGAAELLAKSIAITSLYVDIDEDEIVVCFEVTSNDGYMSDLSIELYDDEFEIVSNNF